MNLCMLMMMVERASKYQNAHKAPHPYPPMSLYFDGACESQLNFILLKTSIVSYSGLHWKTKDLIICNATVAFIENISSINRKISDSNLSMGFWVFSGYAKMGLDDESRVCNYKWHELSKEAADDAKIVLLYNFIKFMLEWAANK